MKKSLILCSLLLTLTASIASAAAGTNLRWNACFGDAGLANRNSTCLANTGVNALTGSFELGADLTQVSGIELVVDIATASAVLPAWWQFFNVGTCRAASLTMNATISPLAVNCAGCSVPACIICNSTKVATPPVVGQPSRDVLLSGPTDATGTSNFATWQGGGGVVVGTRQGCPAAVPTRNTTWGAVKTLYR